MLFKFTDVDFCPVLERAMWFSECLLYTMDATHLLPLPFSKLFSTISMKYIWHPNILYELLQGEPASDLSFMGMKWVYPMLLTNICPMVLPCTDLTDENMVSE